MNYNGWWIDQFNTENKEGQNTRKKKCDLRYCDKCKRVWSRIVFTSKQIYYTNKDVPYYGHKEKICRECEEK